MGDRRPRGCRALGAVAASACAALVLLVRQPVVVRADALPPSTPTGWTVVIANDFSPCNGGVAPGQCFGTANITTTGSTRTSNLDSVTLGGAPFGTAVTPDGSTAVVVNILDGSLSTIDLTRTPPVSLAPVPVGRGSDSLITVAPDGRTAYVDGVDTNSIFPVDLTRRPVAVGKAIPVGRKPGGVAVTPDGSTAWVTNADDGTLQPIALSADGGTPGSPIQVGATPTWLTLAPDGLTAYITRGPGHAIVAVSLRGDGRMSTLDVGTDPQQVVLTPDGSMLYVPTEGTGTITPVSVSGVSMTAGTPFALPHGDSDTASHPWAAAVSPDGRQLWVTDGGVPNVLTSGNTVTAFDISATPMAPVQLRTVAVGFEPRGLAITPAIAGAGSGGPSTIATSLPTPGQAFSGAGVVLASAAVAVGGTVFLTFPSHLFNLTFQENYAAITGWWDRRTRGLRGLLRRRRAAAQADATPGTRRARWRDELPGFAAVAATGALLGSLLDPRFGRNWGTVETFAAVLLAILTAVAVAGSVTGLYHRLRGGPVSRHLRALPLGLLVALTCVVVSRVVGFQPGYLYGVVCLVVFDRRLSPREEGHTAALTSLGALTASVVAWLLWVPVNDRAVVPGAFGGLIVLDDFLAAVFVGGLVGTVIGLLPLRFLPGGAVREWQPAVWAVLFAIALFGLVDFIVRSPAASGVSHSGLWTTVVLFVLFGAASIAFREHFARRWRAEHGVQVHGLRGRLRDLVEKHPGTPGVATAAEADAPASP